MPRQVNYNGSIHSFPDDATDSEIEATLNELDKPQGKTVGGFLENAVKSTGDMVSGITKAAMHPLDTIDTMSHALAGGVEKLIPATKALTSNPETLKKNEEAANAVGAFYKGRYGTLGKVGDTLYNDPIGVMSDVSTLAGGAGLALKGAGMAAKAASVPMLANRAAQAAKIAGKVESATNFPAQVARGAGAVLKVGAKASGLPIKAEQWYESALKPPTGKGWTPQKRERVIKTGLENQVTLQRGGSNSLDDVASKIDEINTEITDKIKNGATARVTIDPTSVAKRVDDLEPFFGNQVNPDADLAAIRGTKGEFLDNNSITTQAPAPPHNPFLQGGTPQPAPPPVTTPVPIPIDKAQQMKQNTYAVNRKKYGELKGAETEAQKALARGLKEEIVSAFPELANLNAKESALIELESAVEAFLKRTNNRDAIPFKAVLAGHSNIAGGLLTTLIDTPVLKSKLAIALYKARNPSTALGTIKSALSKLPMVGVAGDRISQSTANVQP